MGKMKLITCKLSNTHTFKIFRSYRNIQMGWCWLYCNDKIIRELSTYVTTQNMAN